MSYSDNEQFECMFSNVRAAGFLLLFTSLGLRSSQLSEFPRDAILAIADLQEQVHRAIMKEAYFSDEEAIKSDGKVVELIQEGKEEFKKIREPGV